MQESGFTEPPWLIQRNGHFIQVSALLYRVAELANGERTLEEIAAGVTAATHWIVSAAQVRYIVQTKLIPLGLITAADGSVVSPPARERSALAVNMRLRMLSPGMIDPLTRVLQALYAPPVLLPVLLTVALAHGWLYVVHDLAGSIRAALYTPGLLLVVLALMLVSTVFHELGHAVALRYGGGRARGIGVGLYLIYPAFYTDVTDSYRLGRWARLRTDLGGVYFHLVFALGLIALTWVSGQQFLLFVVLLIDVVVLYQFIPFVRLDGYWALADLTGLPDFFALMGPFVTSVVRGGKGTRLPPLKPWVQGVFALYITATIPILGLLFVRMVTGVPSLISTTWAALLWQSAVFANRQNTYDVLGMATSVVQMLLLALPLVGTPYMLYRVSRRLGRALWNRSKPTPMRRLGGGLITAGAIALVALLWVPHLPLGQGRAHPLPVGGAHDPVAGAAVDGVPCLQTEMLGYHIHAALTLYENGQRVPLPANIGIPVSRAINRNGQPTCLYWLHTHGFDHVLGIIHIESPTRRTYRLGQFLDIWYDTALWDAQGGLGHSVDATFVEALRRARPSENHAYVNGKPISSDYRGIMLTAHKVITIEIGRPLKPPTAQVSFPQGD
jgi:putative peptide zinc metalloprotease protein